MEKVNLGFSIVKFSLSAICYSLVCCYTEIGRLMCFEGKSQYSERYCNIKYHIMVTTCVAFTFIIEPALIVASISTPKYYSRTLLGRLFSFAGFIGYTTSGALILSSFISISKDWMINEPPYLATGLLFIITAVVYLTHCIYMEYRRINSKS